MHYNVAYYHTYIYPFHLFPTLPIPPIFLLWFVTYAQQHIRTGLVRVRQVSDVTSLGENGRHLLRSVYSADLRTYVRTFIRTKGEYGKR